MPNFFYHQTRLASLFLMVIGLGIWAHQIRAEEPESKPEVELPSAEDEVLSEKTLDRFVGNLASLNFSDREKAERKLGEVEAGSDLVEKLRQRFEKSADPEIKFRLRRVLYDVAKAEFLGKPKAFLGIQMQDSVVVGGKTGREMILSVMVLAVITDSAAEAQGIKVGDHILSVDGRGFEISPSTEFKGMVGVRKAGDKVKFRLRRGGVISDKEVALGEMPPELMLSTTQSEAAFDSYFQLWLERGGRIERP